MEFTISKNTIENIINNLQPFLEKRDLSQITSHILIETKNDEIIFKATDLEMGLKITIKNDEIKKEGKITANGKKLLDSLKNLKNNKITINDRNKNIEIKQEKTNIKLSSFITENFPEFPKDYQKSKVNINSIDLINSLRKLSPVIEINNPRIEYRNALIDIKEYKFNFVATDTKRLEIISFNNQSIDKLNFMIPKKAINEIQKIFVEESKIFYYENYFIIENEKYLFFTKIPNGNFINYENIIPKEIKHKIQINKEKMIEALKIINSISYQVKLTINQEKIIFESVSSEDSNATTEIELDKNLNKDFIESFKQEENDIITCINSRHILDYIININTDNFEFCINKNKNSSFLLKSNNFILITIPILI